jgi:hypothetical protein
MVFKRGYKNDDTYRMVVLITLPAYATLIVHLLTTISSIIFNEIDKSLIQTISTM